MSIRLWPWSLVLAASAYTIAANPENQSPPANRVKIPNQPAADLSQGIADNDQVDAADAEARKASERFLMVLERNPRKGDRKSVV